jgi:hypothetical protein
VRRLAAAFAAEALPLPPVFRYDEAQMAENREDDGKICTVQYGILYGSGCKTAAPYGFLQRNCSDSVEIFMNFIIRDINRNALRRNPSKSIDSKVAQMTRLWETIAGKTLDTTR